MFLVELVLQGVRGFRELVRLRFQSGFNIIAAGNESGKSTAVDAIQHLLFPTGTVEAMASLVSKYTPDASRGALVVCSDEGAYYRIIQDFVKRAVNLSKYDPASKQFNLLHKDWENTAQFMGGLTHGMSEKEQERVFLLQRELNFEHALHSAYSDPAMPVVSGHKQPQAAAPRAATNQARLAELREILRKAEEAADADYRYQSAKLSLEDLKKKLARIDEMQQKKNEIESSLADLKGCETLPENLSELIESHERQMSQAMAEADDLGRVLEGLKLRLSGSQPANLLTDKLFILGTVLGILSILAGVFVLTAEYAHFFPVGVIVSLILMAVAWYNSSRKNAQRKAISKEAEAAENDLRELERKSVHDGAAINAFMRTVGTDSAGELKEKAENYRYFHSLLHDNEEGRKRILGDMDPDVLRQQYGKQQEEVDRLEGAAKAVASQAMDTYSIRQDIERLEAETSPVGAPWESGLIDQGLPSDFPPPPSPGWFYDELHVASKISGIEIDTLLPAVEAAAQRNLTAISNGRYVRIGLNNERQPVVHANDDSIVPFSELSHGAKALVYFCCRAGLVEAIAGKRRLPFILDDPLAGFDPQRQQAACQVLRSLSTKTQVLLFTSNPALKAAGDAAAELK